MQSDAEHGSNSLSFERLVFFTDAVFAIAITLLALQIHLPAPPANSNPTDAELLSALGGVWPSLLSYLLGFVVVGSLGFLISAAVAFFLPIVSMLLWVVTILASRIVTRIYRVRL